MTHEKPRKRRKKPLDDNQFYYLSDAFSAKMADILEKSARESKERMRARAIASGREKD